MTDHFLRQSFFHFGELILMFLKDLMSCWTLRDRFVVLYRTQFLFFAGKILPVFEMSPYDIDLSK